MTVRAATRSVEETDKPLKVLHDVFGFSSFRQGQEEVVRTLLNGENVLAVMPTGAGKSLCYQLPTLVRGGLTVVVSPLIALMRDQVAQTRQAAQHVRDDARSLQTVSTQLNRQVGLFRM